MSFVPPPAPPPDPWSPQSEPPRPSKGPVIAVLGVTTALLVVGTMLLVVGADDGGETADTVPADLSAIEQELADAIGADPETLFVTRQLTVMFDQDATQATIRRVEREWRANPRLSSIYTFGADEAEGGLGTWGLASWADGNDIEPAERFACSYAGRRGVAMVSWDDTPCDGSAPAPPEVVIEVGLDARVSAAHRETIRRALDDDWGAGDLVVDDEVGSSTLFRLSGYLPSAPYTCPAAARFVSDLGVTVRETGPVEACPEF